MKIVYTDVLVVGGGLAGLRVAIGAKRRGHDAVILSLVPPKRSHSAAAQGGMQASLGNVIKGQGDNEDVHFEDTVRGSDWGADQRVVRMFVNTAPKAVRELAAWGVPWSRVARGDRQVIINGQKVTLTERDEAHGLVAQRDFGGTKKWRTCYVSDGTGHAMLYAVSDRAIAESIAVHERMEAIALIHEGGRCYGAVVRNLATGELSAYVAKATVIATGGAGRLYRVTTNGVICEGIGSAIALETGIATLGNMEAMQFHPTAIFPAGILVTEGCRGDGGLLKDVDGHRFMPDYEPEKKELASRDVVSRRMETHIRKGKGAQSRFGEHLWLDITQLGRAHIEKNLREVKEICEAFLGIDPVEKMIAVRPAQHYTMGGVRTDHTGQSPTLKGAVRRRRGRLLGHAWVQPARRQLGRRDGGRRNDRRRLRRRLLRRLRQRRAHPDRAGARVRRRRAGQARSPGLGRRRRRGRVGDQGSDADRDDGQGRHLPHRCRARVRGRRAAGAARAQPAHRPAPQGGGRQPRARDRVPGAEDAQARALRRLRRRATDRKPGRALPRGLPASRRRAVAEADARELERRRATRCRRSPTSRSTSESMELPPGWRGYGAKDYVDHPDTAARTAEVLALRERLKEAPRFEVQHSLMPYDELLPHALRGRNERIDEPLS